MFEHISNPLILLLTFLFAHLLTGLMFFARKGGAPLFRTLMENAGADIDRRLNRAGRTVADLRVRGLVACLLVGLSALVIGLAVARVAAHAYGWVLTLAFLSINLSAMGVLRMMQQAAKKIQSKNIAAARVLVQPFARDDLDKADSHTIARRALEASAAGLNDFFIAPVFWFLLLQAPGLAVYAALTALCDAVGEDDARHKSFGVFPRAAEKILNYVPARLTAFFIVVAALFVSKSNPLRGLATALSQARGFKPASRGLVIAAAAGGLGVTLAGPIKHNENYTAAHAWVGPKATSAKTGPEDIKRGAMLHFVVFLCVFFTLILLFAAQLRLP